MVSLIQQGQNKESVALHLKLNGLLAANKQASNRMIGIEDLDEQERCGRVPYAPGTTGESTGPQKNRIQSTTRVRPPMPRLPSAVA